MATFAFDRSGTIQNGYLPTTWSKALPITVNDTIVDGCRPSCYCCRLSRLPANFACTVMDWPVVY